MRLHPSVALCILLAPTFAYAQCPGSYGNGFGPCDLDKPARAAIVFDDGTGPALIVGGDFITAGGAIVNQIARWDGHAWSAMGQGVGSVNSSYNSVQCFAVFDDDGPGPHPPTLYASGNFAFGNSGSGIIRWDGASWSLVPGSPIAAAMCVFDDDGAGPHSPALYVGGTFTAAGGLPANHLARWDGQTWTDMGGTLSGGTGGGTLSINTLCVHDDDGPGPGAPTLYAGGYIGFADGLTANHIARWSGAAWRPVGSGMTSIVTSLLSWDEDGPGPTIPTLIAGGQFSAAGGVPAHYIARWNGSVWSALGSGVAAWPSAMIAFDEDGQGPNPARLLVGTSVDIRRWDGASWTAQASTIGYLFGGVTTLAAFTPPNASSPTLIAGGGFHDIDGHGANFIAARTASGFWPLGGGQGLNERGEALVVFDDDGPGPRQPALYVGGAFWSAGTSGAAAIARWNPVGGGSWEGLGAGLRPDYSEVRTLAVFDEDGVGPGRASLYAGGAIVLSGTTTTNYVARWDGSIWTPVPTPATFDELRSLVVVDPDGNGPLASSLYATGYFTNCCVMQWDVSTQGWLPVGGLLPGFAGPLTAFDEDGPGPLPTRLIVGLISAQHQPGAIYALVGGNWQILGGGVSGPFSRVEQLLVMDDQGLPTLFVGGGFLTLNPGITSNNVGRWRGDSGGGWSAVAGGLNPGYLQDETGAYGLAAFHEPGSTVPTLYAAGLLYPMASIQRWTPGTPTWTSAGPGTSGFVSNTYSSPLAMLEFDDDGTGPLPPALYIVGTFREAGGRPSSGIARWSCPAACYANCDQSTAAPLLTANDFQCFLNKFAAKDPFANCDGSTAPPILNANDFQCFLIAFAAGCP